MLKAKESKSVEMSQREIGNGDVHVPCVSLQCGVLRTRG
jgi:hypothetical protein